MIRSIAAFLVALVTFSDAVAAQAQRRVSLEMNLGLAIGSTEGEFRDNRWGAAADALLGLSLGSQAGGRIVVATSAALQGTGTVTAICIPASGGGCVPVFPQFVVVSLLGGWETRDTRLRFLAGPAAATAKGETSVAVQARMEASLPLVSRFSAIASTRGVIVPSYRGSAFQLWSLAIGLRYR